MDEGRVGGGGGGRSTSREGGAGGVMPSSRTSSGAARPGDSGTCAWSNQAVVSGREGADDRSGGVGRGRLSIGIRSQGAGGMGDAGSGQPSSCASEATAAVASGASSRLVAHLCADGQEGERHTRFGGPPRTPACGAAAWYICEEAATCCGRPQRPTVSPTRGTMSKRPALDRRQRQDFPVIVSRTTAVHARISRPRSDQSPCTLCAPQPAKRNLQSTAFDRANCPNTTQE